jgi:hypothetical protein
MRRVGVIAVGPHPPGLDAAAQPVGAAAVARPHAGARAVGRVVGDLSRQDGGEVLADGNNGFYFQTCDTL